MKRCSPIQNSSNTVISVYEFLSIPYRIHVYNKFFQSMHAEELYFSEQYGSPHELGMQVHCIGGQRGGHHHSVGQCYWVFSSLPCFCTFYRSSPNLKWSFSKTFSPSVHLSEVVLLYSCSSVRRSQFSLWPRVVCFWLRVFTDVGILLMGRIPLGYIISSNICGMYVGGDTARIVINCDTWSGCTRCYD